MPSASAPGSLMLLGEYAVLHRQHALVCAIDKRMHVTLTPRHDSNIIIESALGHYETTLMNLHPVQPFQFVLTALHSMRKYLRQGFHLHIACPYGFEPDPALLEQYKHCATLVKTAEEAATGAHSIATDVWTSMGQEAEQSIRKRRFSTYQVNPRLMDLAAPDALFMHCLPAHRGEEISEDMLDDPRSVVWDEAENRLHAQKALMEFLLKS